MFFRSTRQHFFPEFLAPFKLSTEPQNLTAFVNYSAVSGNAVDRREAEHASWRGGIKFFLNKKRAASQASRYHDIRVTIFFVGVCRRKHELVGARVTRLALVTETRIHCGDVSLPLPDAGGSRGVGQAVRANENSLSRTIVGGRKQRRLRVNATRLRCLESALVR